MFKWLQEFLERTGISKLLLWREWGSLKEWKKVLTVEEDDDTKT